MRVSISIALATYNGEVYLKEQIDSFLKQAGRLDELVISDDCSSDSTFEIASNTLKSASFDVVFNQNQHQLGYSQNFNKALELTSGELIFLSDQDDFWLDNKVGTVEKVFEQDRSVYLIIHDLEYCDENLRPIGQTKLGRLSSIGARERSFVTGMATAIKREFLDICLPVPRNPLITHDLWLHECAYALGVKKVLPEVLALYRRHGTNVTTDSVLNRGVKTHFWSYARDSNIGKTKKSIQIKMALLQSLIVWLGSARVCNFYLTNIKNDAAWLRDRRSKFKKELVQSEKRLRLLEKNRFVRSFPAIWLYFRGGYTPFLGLKSLLKDIII